MASRANISRGRGGGGTSRSKIGISRTGGSRSRAGISAHASGLTGSGGTVRVFHNGINVTPQSLLSSSTARYAPTGPSKTPQVKRSSQSKEFPHNQPRQTGVVRGSQDARDDAKTDAGGHNSPGSRSLARRKRDGNMEDKGLTEEDLCAPVTIRLCETPTQMLLEITGSAVAIDLRDYDRYQYEKQEYEKRVAEHVGSDKYISRHTQSVNWAQKTKEVMAIAATTKDVSCAANTWEIFDEQAKGMDTGAGDEGVYGDIGSKTDAGKTMSDVQKQASELATVTLASPGCLLETVNTVAPPPLLQSTTADNGGRMHAGSSALSGSGVVNPNSSRARLIHTPGGGAGTGAAPSQRRRSSQSSKGSVVRKSDPKTHTGNEIDEEATGPMDSRGVAEVLAAQQAQEIMVSKELLNSLELVERSLFQNLLHKKQLEYRNYPLVEDISGGEKDAEGAGDIAVAPAVEGGKEDTEELCSTYTVLVVPQEDGSHKRAGLQKLWTHHYPFTDGGTTQSAGEKGRRAPVHGGDSSPSGGKMAGMAQGSVDGVGGAEGMFAVHRDRTVTALCFHQLNGDVLAVGYGDFFFSPRLQPGGAVLFWSVRNPEYPERVIRTHSNVTSLDFSGRHPNLLAVGMYDGTIAIFDTARDSEHFGSPVAESSSSAGKHTDPVWQVR
ncbi:unnamed protein product, partial [Choristocarpus tenellus]